MTRRHASRTQPSWRRVIVGVGSGLLVAGIALMGRLLWLNAYLTDDLERFYRQPDHQAAVYLEHFPLQRQSYANSCGPTTLSMVYSYLVQPIGETQYAERFGLSLGRGGMLPTAFHASLQRSLVGFDTAMDVNVPDSELLTAIYAQVHRGVPVPIYFATTNMWAPPAHDTHYSALIGVRPQQRTVVIANAYGFQEELPVVDFLQALKYRTYTDAPPTFRLGVLLGIINQNILYRITPSIADTARNVAMTLRSVIVVAAGERDLAAVPPHSRRWPAGWWPRTLAEASMVDLISLRATVRTRTPIYQ